MPMFNILSTLLSFVGLLFTLLGIFTVYCWFKPRRLPADDSNVINMIRIWWFALTRPDKFVDVFPWLKRDEWDNVTRRDDYDQ